MASGDRAGYSQWTGLLHPHISSSTSSHNAQIVLLIFLSHLSTTYVHMVWFPCEQPLHGRLLGVSLPAHAT